MKLSRERVVIICIYILILLSILQLINGYYEKANEYTTMYIYAVNESSLMAGIQTIVFWIAIVCSLSSVINFDGIVNGIILMFSGGVVAWFFIDLINGNSLQSLVLSGVSPCIYLSAFCITFGKRDTMWQIIRRNAPTLAGICSVTSIIFAVFAILQYRMVTGRAPFLIMFTYAFWFIAVTVFCTDVKRIVKWGLMFYCILISIIYGSRGWTITSFLMLIMFIFRSNSESNKKKLIGSLSIPVLFLLLYVAGTSFFADQFNYFIGRIGESTRVEQYKTILKNIDFSFLMGGGMNASYSFGGSSNYQYFDNVFVFNILHFGIIMACLYYLLLIIPLFRLVKKRKHFVLPETEEGLLYVFILWFISINGFSVYNGITYDAKNIFVMLCLGRLLYVSKGLLCKRRELNKYAHSKK